MSHKISQIPGTIAGNYKRYAYRTVLSYQLTTYQVLVPGRILHTLVTLLLSVVSSVNK